MEKKLAKIILPISWIIFFIMVSSSLTLKISNLPASFHHRIVTYHQPHHQHRNLNYYHQRALNDMRFHIKKVLNLHAIENSTIDKYISSMFNVHNENPTYVFELPGKTRIILRRSDFSTAIFPNITNVNKFTQNATTSIHQQNLQASASQKRPVKVKNLEETSSEEIRREKFYFENGFDDYDDNMNKVVEENVRSERDFIDLMNELNSNLEREEKMKPQKPKRTRFHDDKEWDEIGLNGWSGTMVKTKGELPKKSRQKVNTNLIPFYQHFDPFAFLKQQTTTRKPPSMTSEEADIELEKISDQLSSIVMEQEQILLNKTGRMPNLKPRWPITSLRDEHQDNDVFLARANNPFGHSTKWKYRNSSDLEHHREGRSKRGVVNLYSMIKCATGCDPLIYKGYGCYCGFLGNGRALDGIDRCCKAHDYCYTNANCYFSTEYFVPYLWKCYRGKPLCAIDNGEWGGANSCATRLCKCDLALSKCLRHYYCPKKRPVCVSSPLRLLQNLVMVF